MAELSPTTAGGRPRLLFYCQHSVGLGHLVRSLILAGGLAEHFDVRFLSGGPLPDGLVPPAGVELIALPPLGHDPDHKLVSRDPRWSVEDAKQARTERILSAFTEGTAVLLVELFPFGRKKFAFELLPLLEEARCAVHRPLVACSLRDILVGRRREQADHDRRASELANRFLDVVLVHSDPRFARLEESFRPSTPMTVPVHYTGFVREGDRRPTARPASPRRRVLVSAGGGLVGEPLLRTAAAAAPALLRTEGLTTTVVAGPFLPEPAWDRLRQAARLHRGLEVHHFVPDLAAEMADSVVSVSQGGYNTTMDILAAGTPAVVVPFADGGEDEQLQRARRLEAMGALRVLEAGDLGADTLAAAVGGAVRQPPAAIDLDFDGRANTARLVAELARASRSAPAAAGGPR